jgi:selenocysteine-specific elongation factor
VLDCELGLDRGEPLRRRTRLRVHLATADVSGWALPRAAIDPGGTGLVRLLLDRPIVARGGDRFVVRSLSPAAVIGGGIVLDPLPERRSPWLAGLTANDPSERIQALVARRRHGLPVMVAPLVAGLPRRALARALQGRERLRRIGEYLVDEAVMDAARIRAATAIEAHHAEHPADRGMPLESLRRAASAAEWISNATITGMRQRGDIVVQSGLAAARGFRPRVEGGDAIVAQVTAELERAGLAPPSVDELAASFGRPDMPAILRLASASGAVEALERDRYFARTALEGFVRAVRDAGEHSEVTVAGLREMLGLSRKYLIPLLEWADRRGLTVRTGDTRRLRPAPGEPGRAR